MMNEYRPMAEVAKNVGVSYQHVAELRRRGRISSQFGAGCFLVSQAEVERVRANPRQRGRGRVGVGIRGGARPQAQPGDTLTWDKGRDYGRKFGAVLREAGEYLVLDTTDATNELHRRETVERLLANGQMERIDLPTLLAVCAQMLYLHELPTYASYLERLAAMIATPERGEGAPQSETATLKS